MRVPFSIRNNRKRPTTISPIIRPAQRIAVVARPPDRDVVFMLHPLRIAPAGYVRNPIYCWGNPSHSPVRSRPGAFLSRRVPAVSVASAWLRNRAVWPQPAPDNGPVPMALNSAGEGHPTTVRPRAASPLSGWLANADPALQHVRPGPRRLSALEERC
jgi:hypothetical protein